MESKKMSIIFHCENLYISASSRATVGLLRGSLTYNFMDVVHCSPAASIWFEIWGSWIRVKKISILQAISQKLRFFQANFWKISTFSCIFLKNYDILGIKKNRFSRQKLLIYSYFWANYSISLQKSSLSNILPVHDKI